MELQYFGANCLRLTTKQASIVIDDDLENHGLQSITTAKDIILRSTYDEKAAPQDSVLTIEQPGEYEVSRVSIQGIPARAHMDEEGKQSATIFKLATSDLRIVVTGNIHPDLTEDQLEAIGTVDVLVIPVGGNGYTLDATGALKIIKKIEPKVIVPIHYADPKVKYEVPQATLADALKNMNMEAQQTVSKLQLKASDLPETAQVIVVERQ